MPKKLDLTGQRFGRLVALYDHSRNKHGQTIWMCKCDCGKESAVLLMCLRKGMTRSCGCLKNESIGQVNFSHGMSNTRIYGVWWAMIQRCYDKNSHAYGSYGGRGIEVCPKWKDFSGFYEDMGDAGHGMTLERVDNGGGYSPDNVRWATYKEQANNRRSSRNVTVNGETKTLTQWAEQVGVNMSTLWARLSKGWSPEKAILTPKLERWSRHASA